MFNFSKRINGRTYYAATFILFLVVVVLATISNSLIARSVSGDGILSSFGIGLLICTILFMLLYSAAFVRQRSNDISGKHPLIIFIVLYFTPLLLLGGFFPGEKSSNRYGDMPKPRLELF